MKLPNSENALIPREKVRDYLLSRSHLVGRSKAQFFFSLGYSTEHWQRLANDIRQLAVSAQVARTDRTEYGQKYEVRGQVEGPSGRTASIVTAWIVLHGESVPRFVTAYPGGRA